MSLQSDGHGDILVGEIHRQRCLLRRELEFVHVPQLGQVPVVPGAGGDQPVLVLDHILRSTWFSDSPELFATW